MFPTVPPFPTSTYRLQLSSDFTFDDAAEVCGYLRLLGVGWVYVSPVLQAEPGSNHGYDVIDHSKIDGERGGQEAFDRLCATAHREGLGVLADIVPNHMGVATPKLNAWWWELLRDGRNSRFAEAFDVDWDAAAGRIRIPVLGDGSSGSSGSSGSGGLHDTAELDEMVFDGEDLAYFEMRYPIAPGTRNPGDTPRNVHDRQHYELVNWRRADDELNYRRFFAVNSLAGIRVEEPWVFDESHVQIGRWFRDGLVDGLRVDHPDGLADPQEYLAQVASLVNNAPVWVEKILEGDEALPSQWATVGTTGYDALADFDRVLVDNRGRDGLERAEGRLSSVGKDLTTWGELVTASKSSVADGILRSEVNRLARLMPEVDEAAKSLIALIAAFPVYRSYLPLGREYLDEAHAAAVKQNPELAAVMGAVAGILADPGHPAAIRFQQTSGMVMAKGVEDSAFYRYNTLTSLNEVGADPSEFAIDVQTFHARQSRRQESWPQSMTTLSTHDTKRGEDVRARITALSERPQLWESAIATLRTAVHLDDPPLENLVWQAVIGAWPASRDRLHGYVEKASREAGNSTNWITPNLDCEKKLHALVDAAFDDPAVSRVIADTVDAIKDAGFSNGLSEKLMQLSAPGMPDVYQGSELWETSLVDPDNRRPVDFAARRTMLERIDGGWLPPIDDTGAAKLLITSRTLRLRREHPERFVEYRPARVTGRMAAHAIAFDRGGVIAVATRLPYGLGEGGGWHDTAIELPSFPSVDTLTGRPLSGGRTSLSELLIDYPVALVTRAGTT